MDIREAFRTSELWALVAGVVLQVLAFHGLIDKEQAGQWSTALFTYGAMRFVSKTVKASIPAVTNGGSK